MENWKEAHGKAKEYIAALEDHKIFLRDQAIKIASERDELKRDRDEWNAAYQEAMRPTLIY